MNYFIDDFVECVTNWLIQPDLFATTGFTLVKRVQNLLTLLYIFLYTLE